MTEASRGILKSETQSKKGKDKGDGKGGKRKVQSMKGPIKIPKKFKACKFFVAGNCTLGKKCEWSHDRAIIEPARKFAHRDLKTGKKLSGKPKAKPKARPQVGPTPNQAQSVAAAVGMMQGIVNAMGILADEEDPPPTTTAGSWAQDRIRKSAKINTKLFRRCFC